MKRRLRASAGVTLLEMLIAVSLVALLSVGMLLALRISLDGSGRAQAHITANRRVLGVERVLREQIVNLMPVSTECGTVPNAPGIPEPFFQGEASSLRFVSTYSLAEAARGNPHVLEFQVIPGENGLGVRLIVNEIPWTGRGSRRQVCIGQEKGPEDLLFPLYAPIQTGPGSFVLADRLAYCHLTYLQLREPPLPPRWIDRWPLGDVWPSAIHVEMAPLAVETARLNLSSITIPIRVNREALKEYRD